MIKYILKTIYPLFILLYIFVSYQTNLGNSFEGVGTNEVSIIKTRYPQTELNIGNLSFEKDVLGLATGFNWKNEQSTIHQIEDKKYSKLPFANAEIRNTSESKPTAYSYHQNIYNDKEVLGFVPYWELSKYRDIDYSKLSTIAYFSLTTDDTGAWIQGYLSDDDGNGEKEWHPDGGYNGINSANFANMVTMAHAKGTKVVLVVKNFDPYSIRQIILNRDNAGNRLINNIVNTISTKGLDGVNVDFEYVPRLDRDAITNELRLAFANWHTQLADRVHSQFPGAHVSTDVFGSSGVSYSMYDMIALGDSSLDYILMMTYDYIITSCWDGKKIAPMSPLYGNNLYGTPNWNTSSHLTAGANKAGSAKILMGVPYYGIDFQVKSVDKDVYNARVDYPNCRATIETYASIVDPSEDAYHNSSTLRWNPTEKARWYTYNYNGKWRNGYYDDPSSLAAKYDFVRSANLGGIGIWVIGYDDNAKELYNVMRDKFQTVPFYISFRYGISIERISSIFSSCNVEMDSSLGNNAFKVSPTSGVSGQAMKCLRLHNEVVDVSFETDSNIRGIN